MVHCIPEEPDFPEKLTAERVVWEKLRESLPDDVVLLHSVSVRHGKSEHEIDLLVLWPNVGLAAIEVKGGVVSCDQAQWYQSDRQGRHKIQSPMAQVQGAAHAFQDWISERMGTRISSRFAHIVCFPYTSVDQNWEMSGIPRELVIDQKDLSTIEHRLRNAIERQGGGFSGLAPIFVQRMLPHLSGDLKANHVTESEARGNEDVQNSLTQRQATLLSATRSLDRVMFVGGAGSGKTWLAVEKAKSLSAQNKRVGLFCYNKGLGQFLKSEVARWRQNKPAHTGEFHEYVRSLGIPDGKGQAYFEVEMPRMLREHADSMPEHEKFDAIVVDEAQDFAPDWWDALLACTKDPLNGKVFAFMDSRQDVYRRWDGEPLGGSYGQASPLIPIHVDENLRNTRRIADTFKPMSGDHFKSRGGTGMPVRFVQCATEDAVNTASDCVDSLVDEGWANNQIALLTTHRRHPIHQDAYDNGTIDSEYWQEFHADNSEFYGHVLGFKGLERSVIILCINGFKTLDRAVEMLYVGFSRARSLLIVVGDGNLLAQGCGDELRSALDGAESWKPIIGPHATVDLCRN